MTKRLSRATMGELSQDVRRPSYERTSVRPGVVHIGLGAFHRAHQVPVFETLVEGGDMGWGVTGASLRSPGVRNALAPQDGLYTLLVEEDDRTSIRLLGAIVDVIVAREDPRRLVETIAAPATHLVTVTVTEKGYKLDPASGALLTDDPDVQADLASLTTPLTMPGYVAAGLALRKERGLEPLTIASCDNVSDNGDKLRAAVRKIARAHDEALAKWIEERCAFPNSMIDRIVPATTEGDIAATAAQLGLIDRATIRTEPFTQWVIEDRLVGPAIELSRAGVQVAAGLAPWERAKLRLLNGAHSSMAYLGGLAGLVTVDEFVAQPWGERFVEMLWDEVEPTLQPPPELSVSEYRGALMRRFANSALGHRLRQIAMDGSQKLPQRLLASAADLLSKGKEPNTIALAVAAWMQWQGGRDDSGASFDIDDPLASTTARLVAGARNAADYVAAFLSLASVFPQRLAVDARFLALLTGHLESLQRTGARASVEQLLKER